MGKTHQGDSGWYCAPDGQIYYFVQKNAEWIQVVGPLTPKEYELERLNINIKQRSGLKVVLTPTFIFILYL